MASRKVNLELNPDDVSEMEQMESPKAMTPEEEKAALDAWLNEKIPFFAFKDNGQYKDDIVVWVNDDYCKIQRGKHVMVKRKFMLALESSARQKQVAAEIADGYERQFDSEVRPMIV